MTLRIQNIFGDKLIIVPDTGSWIRIRNSELCICGYGSLRKIRILTILSMIQRNFRKKIQNFMNFIFNDHQVPYFNGHQKCLGMIRIYNSGLRIHGPIRTKYIRGPEQLTLPVLGVGAGSFYQLGTALNRAGLWALVHGCHKKVLSCKKQISSVAKPDPVSGAGESVHNYELRLQLRLRIHYFIENLKKFYRKKSWLQSKKKIPSIFQIILYLFLFQVNTTYVRVGAVSGVVIWLYGSAEPEP
jgi:hypothetical protein